MERELLYQVLYSQQKEFSYKENLINRSVEKQISILLKTKLPIIITGVRRCGKSSLLKLLNYDDWLYVNFNDERLLHFSNEDFQKIIDYLQEQKHKKKCALFLDEIQETNAWEKWIDRIKEDYDIFITGSNSKLLSGEFASRLTGRALAVKMYPFSFEEYLTAKKIDITSWPLDIKIQSKIRTALKHYLTYGGFPKFVLTEQNVVISELYENIMYKDIISRFNKNQTKNIKELLQYLISNISKPLSIRTLSEISGIKNLGTIKQIIDLLEDAFLMFTINKFDYSIKKQLQNPKKIYCIDNGILTTKGFNFSENNGRLLENLVFLKLKQEDKEIYYYKDNYECDFLIKEKSKITKALQVCYDLNEGNKERETKGLIDAMNKFKLKEGIIITFDQEQIIKEHNIKVIPVWKWLL